MLIDVGASGGIDGFWAECFGPKLKAVGFDPLLAEVDRLNKNRGYGGIRYEAAFVGYPEFDTLFPPALKQDTIANKDNSSFPDTSAARAAEAMQMNSIKEVYNAGAEIRLTDRLISLDDYVRQSGVQSVDFVKIDTDGHDIEVLLGAWAFVSKRKCMAAAIPTATRSPTSTVC